MYRKLFLSLCLVLFSAAMVVAEENGPNVPNGPNPSNASNGSGDTEAKKLKGMSVLGNNEAPMSLFIVPWKTSELGMEADLKRTLDERDVPVDRDVFKRELDFYQVSVSGNTSASAALNQH